MNQNDSTRTRMGLRKPITLSDENKKLIRKKWDGKPKKESVKK